MSKVLYHYMNIIYMSSTGYTLTIIICFQWYGWWLKTRTADEINGALCSTRNGGMMPARSETYTAIGELVLFILHIRLEVGVGKSVVAVCADIKQDHPCLTALWLVLEEHRAVNVHHHRPVTLVRSYYQRCAHSWFPKFGHVWSGECASVGSEPKSVVTPTYSL